jgi:hypothetical protein
MKLFLSSDRDLLPVVDAVELIAQHIVDRDERPVLADDGVPDQQKRPPAKIALIAKEREWAGRIREAVVSGALHLYDAEGFRIAFDQKTFALACVKPAGLTQWLVDAYGKVVTLDDVQVEPTPLPPEREKLKRELLVERYERRNWPSIHADLLDGSRNGLMAAAGEVHGYYDVQRALRWARERGKLLQEPVPVPWPGNDLPSMIHRIK